MNRPLATVVTKKPRFCAYATIFAIGVLNLRMGTCGLKACPETVGDKASCTAIIIECICFHWLVGAFLCHYSRENGLQQDVVFKIRLLRDVHTCIVHLQWFILGSCFSVNSATFFVKREAFYME